MFKYLFKLLPANHEDPRLSTTNCGRIYEKLPVPTVNESPMLPIMSMSPGLTSCTLIGRVRDRVPFVLQKNLVDFGNSF